MSVTSQLRNAYLSYFSSPAADRLIYRAIRKQKAKRILELGIGIGRRASRMLEIAAACSPAEEVHYFGVDMFEGRSPADGQGVTLKMAHRLLKRTGAKVQLIPGQPGDAMRRSANAIGTVDLLVISAQLDKESMRQAWFYIPRLLHAGTRTFAESLLPNDQTSIRLVGQHELTRMAHETGVRRAA